MADSYSELLFSYGTLRGEAVQRANFGRKLQGSEISGNLGFSDMSSG